MNKIYEKGITTEVLRRAVFNALPKKPQAQECKYFRTIGLMNHANEIIQKMLLYRIKKTIKNEVSDCQFGFKPDRGTRNAIAILRCIAERSLEVNQDIYCFFIDYTKAFNRLQYNFLMEIFSELNKDLRLVQNMYFNKSASIRHNGKISGQV